MHEQLWTRAPPATPAERRSHHSSALPPRACKRVCTHTFIEQTHGAGLKRERVCRVEQLCYRKPWRSRPGRPRHAGRRAGVARTPWAPPRTLTWTRRSSRRLYATARRPAHHPCLPGFAMPLRVAGLPLILQYFTLLRAPAVASHCRSTSTSRWPSAEECCHNSEEREPTAEVCSSKTTQSFLTAAMT